jgi:hypothetical protein
MRTALLASIVFWSLAACNAKKSQEEEKKPDIAIAAAVASCAAAAPVAAEQAKANDGTDPKAPVLSPEDATFVDTRQGRGWGDRCFSEIKAGKLGWARAACDRGLALPDVDAAVRPALLYNEALIAKKGGDAAAARSYLEHSLALRAPGDPGRSIVEQELVSLGGSAPSAGSPPVANLPITTFRGNEILEQMSFAKVTPEYTDLGFTTLYQADIDNDGHYEFVLSERNSVGLHNDTILGVYASSTSSQVMIDSKLPIPKEGPFQHAIMYLADPFLRADPEGITMTFLEGPRSQPVRYLWKGGHIRLLDKG